MGIYVGTKTSFILGFATNLCVVFGSCHKDNVAVVNKKSTSHICAYTSKGLVKLQLGLLVVVNKTQFDPVYARRGT